MGLWLWWVVVSVSIKFGVTFKIEFEIGASLTFGLGWSYCWGRAVVRFGLYLVYFSWVRFRVRS